MAENLIEIYAGPAHVIKNNEIFLSQRFSKDHLYSILLDIREVFNDATLIYFNNNGIRCAIPPEANAYRKKGNLLKKELTLYIGYFISDRRNILAYFNRLDESKRKLYKYLLKNYFIKLDAAEEVVPGLIGDFQSISSSTYYYNEVRVVDKLPWLNYYNMGSYWNRYSSDTCLAFDRTLHRCFASAILSEGWRVDASAPTDDKRYFNAESEMGRNLLMIGMLDANGQLVVSQNKLPDSVIKRISASANITEFFPDAGKDYANLRALLMLNFFAYSLPGRNVDFRKLFEAFTKSVSASPSYFFALFGRHIRGLSPKYRRSMPWVFIGKLVDVLRGFGREKPVAVRQFVKEIIMNDDVNAMTVFELSDIWYTFIENRLTGDDIKPVDIVRKGGVSFVYGFIALLAAIGAAEIWYDAPGRNQDSYFASISHFRLTPLGEYMLGFIDKYELPEADALKMELSPDSLVISLPSESTPIGGVISAMAEKIGPSRYCTSETLMLNGCRTPADISDRMEFFRKTAREMPENWIQFFNRLLDHCQPFRNESLNKYSMYSLSPSNTDLQRLLSTDPLLKSMVIRMEGFRILVDDDNLIRFKERLRQLGYLF